MQRPGDGGAHRHDRAVGAHREHDRGVADRERRLRSGDQALPEAPDLVAGDRSVRKLLEAGVDRPEDRGDARRSVTRVGAQVVEQHRVLETEAAGRRAHQRPEVGTGGEVRAKVPCERPDVRPGRAADVDDRHRPRGVGGVPVDEVERVDRDLARGELDGLARARELVRAPSRDLDRAVVGRDLADRAGEGGQACDHGVAGDRRAVNRRPLAVDVVRRRPLAEADRRPVALRRPEVILDEPRRAPQEHGQDARGERVERPAVADPARRRQAPDEADHVVRGRPRGLGDDQDAVEPARPPAAAHRLTAAASRAASAPTATTASSSGFWIGRAGRARVAAAAEGPRSARSRRRRRASCAR